MRVSTVHAEAHTEVTHSTWRSQMIPAFPAPVRLVVDYAMESELKIRSLMQVLAYRLHAELQPQSSRSYASTALCRRRVFYISLDASQYAESAQQALDAARAAIGTSGVEHVAIGRENAFQLDHSGFIFTFNDLSWMTDRALAANIDDIVFVSAPKAVFKLKAPSSPQQMLDALCAFDAKHPGTVRKLMDNRARDVFLPVTREVRMTDRNRGQRRPTPKRSTVSRPQVVSLAKHLGDELQNGVSKRRKINLELALPENPTQLLTSAAHSTGGGRGPYSGNDGDVPMCLLSTSAHKRRAFETGFDQDGSPSLRKRGRGTRSAASRDAKLLSTCNWYRSGSAQDLFQHKTSRSGSTTSKACKAI